MKPNLKNFTGDITLRYRIAEESKVNEHNTQVNLYYETLNPITGEWDCMDASHGMASSYAKAMTQALQRAEKKWGISLIKENLKTA